MNAFASRKREDRFGDLWTLALMASAAAASGLSPALAGDLTPVAASDYLFVSKNLTAIPTNPNPQEMYFVNETATGAEDVIVVPLRDLLLRPGYVVLWEPLDPNNPTAAPVPSDYLVSVTGASLQFYSDGAPGFPPNVANLPKLGEFYENPDGLTVEVGDLFSPIGALAIPAADIRIFSDGDLIVPEPASLVLIGAAAAAAPLGRLRRRGCPPSDACGPTNPRRGGSSAAPRFARTERAARFCGRIRGLFLAPATRRGQVQSAA